MRYVAFQGYVVTAHADGTIPINSRVVGEPLGFGIDPAKVTVDREWLLDRLNKLHEAEGMLVTNSIIDEDEAGE